MGSKKYHNAEWLREKYHGEGLTMREIADECGVTNTTIGEWMDRHGIDKRDQSAAQRPDGKYTNREWLATQYHVKGRTLADIGEECDVGPATILKWMRKFDIPRREATDHKKKEPAAYQPTDRGYVQIKSKSDGEKYQLRVHQLVAIAAGADPHKVFSDGEYQCHHKNGVKWDNRPENIEVLSQYDHDTLHAAERERAETGEFL